MNTKGKLRQDKVLTAIVGSYPKPKYVFPKTGRNLIDSTGFLFDAYEKNIGKGNFNLLLDKATKEAIEDQNSAGIDFISDGEERRSQYVMHILKGLGGIDFKKLRRIVTRGGIYERDVPTIVNKVVYKKPIILSDFTFTAKNSKKMVKVNLPGPSTVVDSLADDYYHGDLQKIAYDYADAIRHEVQLLIKAGCTNIQFDDPVLLRHPDHAKKWGLKALEKCFEGFENQATFFVHICRGYPNKPLEKKGVSYKANKEYYQDILSWLAKSKLDVVSIEGAQSNLDVSILPAIGKKTVMLGVLDVGVNTVETVTSLTTRAEEALYYIPKEQLILAPDCGMLEITKTAAYKKLRNLAKAAEKINRRLENVG